jgi:integrase/recombinase XerD
MLRFLAWLEVTNFSRLTIVMRRWQLGTFQRWCRERDITTPAALDRRTLEQYQRFLFCRRKANGEGLKATTRSNLVIAVRMFLSWLVRQNQLLSNPSADLDLPRIDNTLPRGILTPAEVDQVMAQPDITTAFGIRDRTILETFYSTGIRRCELAKLAVRDVVFDRGLLFVRQGKGGKDRVVPIGIRACRWIEKYLIEVRPLFLRDPQTNALFLTHRGKPLHQDVLTRLVSHFISRSGIDKTGSCHLLRHSMATAMLENGADIRVIQEILGHEKLDSTQIYTRVSILRLKEVHRRTHPARLKMELPRQSDHGPTSSP